MNELNLFQPSEEDLDGDISDSQTEEFDESEQHEKTTPDLHG